MFLWDISSDTFPETPEPHAASKKTKRPAGPCRPLVKATCWSLRSGFITKERGVGRFEITAGKVLKGPMTPFKTKKQGAS